MGRWIRSLFEAKGLDVVLAFGVAVACISPFPDGALAPRWAIISLVPLLAFVRRDAEFSPWTLLALAWCALSLVWSPDRWHGADLLWHFVCFAVILSRPVDLRPVLFAVGTGLAVNTVVVMAQIEGYNPVASAADALIPGLFFNRNQQNSFVAIAAVGLLSLKDWRAVLLAIFVSLPLFAYPVERAPLIGLAAAAGFLACRRFPALIPAAVILVAGLLVHLVNDPKPYKVDAIVLRLVTWMDAAEHLTFFGNGIGSFRWRFSYMEYAHNDLIQIAYELGVPGVVGAVALMWKCVRGPTASTLMLVVFATEGLFDFPLYQPAAGFLAAAAVGHALARRDRLRQPVADREWIRGLRQAAPRSA